MNRELKKFQGYNVTASAVLPSEVAELALLQYLQYFSSPRDSASCICGSKYVVCPLIYAMVRNSSGDVARATSSPHLSDSDDDSPAGQQHDLSEYCSRSLFAFPSFKLPLSAVLDSGIKVTSELSLQWAWQLLLVADYLISR